MLPAGLSFGLALGMILNRAGRSSEDGRPVEAPAGMFQLRRGLSLGLGVKVAKFLCH
jgi:hypothetical protein